MHIIHEILIFLLLEKQKYCIFTKQNMIKSISFLNPESLHLITATKSKILRPEE